MKIANLKSTGQTIDYILIETDRQKIIKPKAVFIAEEQLGRPLSDSEIPVLEPFTGKVKIKTHGLQYPEFQNEVKDVPGVCSEAFMISTNGILISKRTDKIVRQRTNKNGYLCHATKIDGRNGTAVNIKIHQAVAKAFIDNPDDKPQINHKNGDKTDAHVSNLEFNTGSENICHAYETGLIKKVTGYDHPSSKLTVEQVTDIKKRLNAGLSRREVSRQTGIGKWTIDSIANGTSNY